MKTVADPLMMVSGGPTQVSMSPTTEAGSLPINTVGTPGPMIGPPTCGIGTGPAGVCIGHTCISEMRAAGGMVLPRQLIMTTPPVTATRAAEFNSAEAVPLSVNVADASAPICGASALILAEDLMLTPAVP